MLGAAKVASLLTSNTDHLMDAISGPEDDDASRAEEMQGSEATAFLQLVGSEPSARLRQR